VTDRPHCYRSLALSALPLVALACGQGQTKWIGAHDSESSLDADSAGTSNGGTTNDGTNDDGTSTDAGGDASCSTIQTPPSALALDPFYEKYTDALGIPVVSSDDVPDTALTQACLVVNRMLAKRSDVRAQMIDNGARVAVIASDQGLKALPELTGLSNDWNDTRGVGATATQPLTVGTEENLLCLQNDVHRGEVILVHSLAHAIRSLGISQMEEDFDERLEASYQAALFEGKWTDAFARESFPQYWAEGVQCWFNANLSPPNPYHNEINTRAELAEYDPRLYELIAEYMPETDDILDCF